MFTTSDYILSLDHPSLYKVFCLNTRNTTCLINYDTGWIFFLFLVTGEINKIIIHWWKEKWWHVARIRLQVLGSIFYNLLLFSVFSVFLEFTAIIIHVYLREGNFFWINGLKDHGQKAFKNAPTYFFRKLYQNRLQPLTIFCSCRIHKTLCKDVEVATAISSLDILDIWFS